MHLFGLLTWLALTSCGASADSPPVSMHHEPIAPGVYAAAFAAQYHDANCGWVALDRETLLIDLPRGLPVREYLKLAVAAAGKPLGTLALTTIDEGDVETIRQMIEAGVKRIVVSPEAGARLRGAIDASKLAIVAKRCFISEPPDAVEFLPLDHVAAPAGAAVWIAKERTLFAGPTIVHGPRAPLARTNTASWVVALRQLHALAPARVGAERLDRQLRFLTEVRRQVGYQICQGRPIDCLNSEVHLPSDIITWFPYGNPLREDLEHVYGELTVPAAPFGGSIPAFSDGKAHALVLIGDEPHEPGHIEDGLRPIFEGSGVVPHFAVDVRALSATNLAAVPLLVILRDGLMRSFRGNRKHSQWITPEQESAVVAFVERGGGFLNLHNSMGEYPDNGPYLQLVGGRYLGHGPLERFQVELVDPAHPVVRGVTPFFVADEQHTPSCDEKRVHILLRSRSDQGTTAPAGWVREVGRGRVCHLANGHTTDALSHPMYQKLVRNALAWCIRHDNP